MSIEDQLDKWELFQAFVSGEWQLKSELPNEEKKEWCQIVGISRPWTEIEYTAKNLRIMVKCFCFAVFNFFFVFFLSNAHFGNIAIFRFQKN